MKAEERDKGWNNDNSNVTINSDRGSGGGEEEASRRSRGQRGKWSNSGGFPGRARDNRSPGLIDSILPRPFQSLAAPTLHKNAADWSVQPTTVALRFRFGIIHRVFRQPIIFVRDRNRYSAPIYGL